MTTRCSCGLTVRGVVWFGVGFGTGVLTTGALLLAVEAIAVVW